MQKKQSEAYERITRSNPKGIKPKIVINQINIKMIIFGNNFLTKNPFTKSLIKNAEYKKIPKSSYPVSIVQIDSIKSIAYCNIYQFILKMVRKHRIVQIVFMKGIVIFG